MQRLLALQTFTVTLLKNEDVGNLQVGSVIFWVGVGGWKVGFVVCFCFIVVVIGLRLALNLLGSCGCP